MRRCFLGLGGNVGDVGATFRAALDRLAGADDRLRVVRTSSLYQTAAVGKDAGNPFLNAVVEIETDLPPLELLERTQRVEEELGRQREMHWGPRPLDVDILLYGEEIVDEPHLQVPHAGMWYRRFVLDPLAEIAPDVTHPERENRQHQRATIWQLRQRLLVRPFCLQIISDDDARRNRLLAELRRRFPEIDFDPTGNLGGTMAVLGRGGFISIPDDDDGGLEFLTAVITAATDEPVIVAGPIVP